MERMTDGGGLRKLEDQYLLAILPTPRGEDSECVGAHRGNADGLHSMTQLAIVTTTTVFKSLTREVKLANLSSPSSRDYKDTPGMSETGVDPDGSTRQRLDQLPRQAQLAGSGQIAIGGTGGTENTGQLNPAYSRWLQGLPDVWDDCAVTVTRSVRPSRKRSSKA